MYAFPLLLLLGCPSPDHPQPKDTYAPHDTQPPSDSRAGDTGDSAACPPPSFLGDPTLERWVGSRYDLLFEGAQGATIDGEALACATLGLRLHCAWTPSGPGEPALSANSPGCAAVELTTLPVIEPSGVHPRGDRYMMALYSAEPSEHVATFSDLAAEGVNAAHTYSAPGDYLDSWQQDAATAGLIFSAHVGDADEIEPALTLEGLGWWELPEELRYWYPDELNTVRDLSQAIRAVDNRPVYMYIPGHYHASDIAYYVEHLDLIGAGAYAEYAGQPHAWVRWRVESEIEAIELAGYTIADKTPLGIIGVFDSRYVDNGGVPDRTEVVHDHLAAVAAGARGLYTFSWWHAVYDQDVGQSAQAILDVATRISGEEALGEWVLRGADKGTLDLSVTSGPTEVEVTPHLYDEPLVYPSVWARAWEHAGAWTVVAVNSSEQEVTSTVSGLPGERVERIYDGVLQEAPGGTLELTLGRLEVRVMRVVVE